AGPLYGYAGQAPETRAGRAPSAARRARGEPAIELVGKGLPVARVQRLRTAGLDAGAAQFLHEVPHRQAFGHVVGRVALAARVERRRAALDHARGQRDVLGDDQVAGADAPDDLAVGHVEAAGHLDGVDQARGRRAQPLV